MGVVNFLTAVLIMGAIANLVALFRAIGLPQSPRPLFTPGFFLALIFLTIGFEIVRRKARGRTGLLAVIYFSLISSVYFLVKLFLIVSSGAGLSGVVGVDSLLEILKKANLPVSNLVMAITVVVFFGAVVAGVGYVVLRRLFSDDVIEAFGGEDAWFERELRIAGWDSKPWIIVVVLAFAASIGFFYQQEGPRASTMEIAAAMQRELKKEAEEIRAKDAAAVDEKHRAEDKQRVVYASFTQSNQGLWVVLSSGRLAYYDFANYQPKVFDFKAHFPSAELMLSPTGRHFYSPTLSRIVRVDTGEALKEAVFDSARTFLGFSKTGHYLVYADQKSALQLINVENGTKIFEIAMGMKLGPDDIAWSPSRSHAFFKFSDKDCVFLDAVAGKFVHQKVEFRFPEIVLDDLARGAVFVGGPIEFTKQYKTYLVDPATLAARPLETNKKIVALHPISESLLTMENFSLGFVDRSTLASDNPLKMEYRRFAAVPGTEMMAVVEDQAERLQLLDLKTGLKSVLGGAYQTGRGVSPNVCYLTASGGGHLLFTSCWKQAEVFWVSTLRSPQVQSWRISLPFEDEPVSSRAPASKEKK